MRIFSPTTTRISLQPTTSDQHYPHNVYLQGYLLVFVNLALLPPAQRPPDLSPADASISSNKSNTTNKRTTVNVPRNADPKRTASPQVAHTA
jgi:hypothetical protein